MIGIHMLKMVELANDRHDGGRVDGGSRALNQMRLRPCKESGILCHLQSKNGRGVSLH
jgi:hypothetical protein